jgi:hypothetical protein
MRCKRARKQLAQINWVNKNPGYFRGRYEYVKEWRNKRKQSQLEPKQEMIQERWNFSFLMSYTLNNQN